MKSSDPRRGMSDNAVIKDGFLSNGPLYALLVLYMPLSALAAFVFLAGAFFPAALPLSAIIISACISAIAASLYCDFMKDVKSSLIAADIRGAIIIMGIIYAFVSILRPEIPLKERFRPDIANIMSAVGALYVWCSVVSLKQLFSARRHFEKYTELYREAQLQEALLEDSSLLYYTDEKIIKVKRNYIVQLVIIGILAFVSVLMKVPLSLSLYLLLIGILAVGICICCFFDIMRMEQYYAGEGLALSAADRHKRTIGMGIFILFCIVCALLAASDTSLLPFSALIVFFARLLSLLSRLFTPSAKTFEHESFKPMEMPQFPGFQDESTPGSFTKWMSEYGLMILKYGLIVLAAAAFIWFMISPLLNRGKADGKLKFHERLLLIIIEWFKGMLSAMFSFLSFLKNDKNLRKINKYNAEEIRRTTAAIMNVYSRAKKQDMRRSVTLFARLIIWGGEVCQLTWKPSYAPGEYCGILAASVPALVSTSVKNSANSGHESSSDIMSGSGSLHKHLSGGIIRCGELFEQALYSAEVLSAGEQREFKELVEEITSVTAKTLRDIL